MLTEDPKKWLVMPNSVDSFTTWPAPSSATRPCMALACELYELVPRGLSPVLNRWQWHHLMVKIMFPHSFTVEYLIPKFHGHTHMFAYFTPDFPVANGDVSQNCWKSPSKSRSFNFVTFSIFRQTVIPDMRKFRTPAGLDSASPRSPQCSPSGQEMESLGPKRAQEYWLKTWFYWVWTYQTQSWLPQRI